MRFLSCLFGRRPAHESPAAGGRRGGRDSITWDGAGITRRRPDGRIETMAWADLREVAVVCRPGGPAADDHHIVLTGRERGILVGRRVTGAEAFAQRLEELPGFDHATFVQAMSTPERARFVCWRSAGVRAQAPAPAIASAPATRPATRPPASPAGPRQGGAFSLKFAPGLDTVEGYAEDTVRNMQRIYGIAMDYSPESLAHVDRVLAEWREQGVHIDAVTKSIFSMGSYAGEVVRRHSRGRWTKPRADSVHADIEEWFVAIELANGRRWAPVALCIRVLLDGPSHSVARSARQALAEAGAH